MVIDPKHEAVSSSPAWNATVAPFPKATSDDSHLHGESDYGAVLLVGRAASEAFTNTTALTVSAFGQAPRFKMPETGTDLVHQCAEHQLTQRGAANAAIEASEIGYGMGYCFGVINTTFEILQAHGEIHVPDGDVTFEQVKKIVTNYLDAHPEEWQKPASAVAAKALKQAWGSTTAN